MTTMPSVGSISHQEASTEGEGLDAEEVEDLVLEAKGLMPKKWEISCLMLWWTLGRGDWNWLTVV